MERSEREQKELQNSSMQQLSTFAVKSGGEEAKKKISMHNKELEIPSGRM